jgi:hypothetical protein
MIRLVSRLAVTTVAAVAGIALAACSSSCADAGCVQAVTITLERPLSDPGSYEVDFVADGVTMSCTLTVPSTKPSRCTNSRAFVSQEEGRGIVFLSMDGKFESLSVTVLRDGSTLAEQTYSVAYQGVELNGPGCGTCPAASETLKATESDAGLGDAG